MLFAAALVSVLGCSDASTPAGASAQEPAGEFIHARVNRVYDGDSFRAFTKDGTKLEVRLAEIDAPEKGDPWANRARDALQKSIGDRDVAIRLFDTDRYGRIVGRVFVGTTDVNVGQLQAGLACVHRRYAKDASLYDIEDTARAASRGLWSTDYRPRGCSNDSAPRTATTPLPAGCGPKRYCRQMSSCAEAREYLQNCGLSSLDGDGDGMPCERGVCAGKP